MSKNTRIKVVLTHCAALALQLHVAFSAQADNSQVDRYFGLHVHRIVKTQPWLRYGTRLTSWPSVQFGSWRLWDAYVAWKDLEPYPGQWNFSVLDDYVSRAEAEGVDVVLPLGLTPVWASSRPGEVSGYGPGNAAEPRDLSLWRQYVRTVSARYRNRITAYEIWNEVNLSEFFTGSVSDMIALARIAYETVKEVDPRALVVSPSVTGAGGGQWLATYLGQGGGQYADVIAYHLYVPAGRPEEMIPLIRSVREVMNRTGNSMKPLWNTETGWWLENGDGTADHPAIEKRQWKRLSSQVEAPAYLARAFLLGKAFGVARFFWYSWDNLYGQGLLEPSTGSPKPAVQAFGKVVTWLAQGDSLRCAPMGNVWQCVVSAAGVEKVLIVWAEGDSPMSFVASKPWRKALGESLMGAPLAFTPDGKIALTGSPVALIRRD